MNIERFEEDPELTRLLSAVRADADPALWTRVRARIEARQHLPALVRWAMRPAALAVSLTLLAAVAAGALMLGTGTSTANGEQYTSIADALVDERDIELQSHQTMPAPAPGVASDTGAAR